MPDRPAGKFVNDIDARSITDQADPQQRAIMAASVTRYRRADSLFAGDFLPELVLTRLSDGEPVPLGALSGTKPLLLIFGSYT